jgi:hypothetical protein
MIRIRILDLDGSLLPQREYLEPHASGTIPAREWGPRIRLACSLRSYAMFRDWLGRTLPPEDPAITFYGSGDFHHVTLALLARIPGPFNLLVLDKHPDWMRGIPFLHCGTWLRHALRLPNLNRVFHCGGDLDFDNAYRVLAPWDDLGSGRVVVFPAARRYRRGRWRKIAVYPLLAENRGIITALDDALDPFLEELGRFPLYVSIDKDVLTEADAAVNWDSGLLSLSGALSLLETFLAAAGGRLAGADVLGDWSPVVLGHPLSRLCHRLDHPGPDHEPDRAVERNSRANGLLLNALRSGGGG